MTQVLELLGAAQANGGLLGIGVYLVWTMRAHRDDFKNHSHGADGKPYVKKRASEL